MVKLKGLSGVCTIMGTYGKNGFIMKRYDSSVEDKAFEMKLLQKVYVLYKIATNLDELHKNFVIHCDLALRNVLIKEREDKEDLIVLTDFGLSVVQPENSYDDKHVQRVRRPDGCCMPIDFHSCPEDAGGCFVSRTSDIFNFGTTMFSLLNKGLKLNEYLLCYVRAASTRPQFAKYQVYTN
eukprot:UN29276